MSKPFDVLGFNPHSSFRPSATLHPPPSYPQKCSFNPHSSFRPSATNGPAVIFDGGDKVSILTRAFARVQGATPPRIFEPLQVSILTRAFARVQGMLKLIKTTEYRVSILTRAFARVQRAG